MLQTIIKCDEKVFYERLKKEKLFIILSPIILIIINIIFSIFVKDDTRLLFMLINICSDVIFGWLYYYFLTTYYLKNIRLSRLLKARKIEIVAKVKSIEEKTMRYLDFDCYLIDIDGRLLYLIDDSAITLEIGKEYKFSIVSNIIVSIDSNLQVEEKND